MAGRPRKPTALHILDGTKPNGHVMPRTDEPTLIPVTLEAPEVLIEEEKYWFDHFAKAVGSVGMKITTQDDEDALEQLACTMTRVQRLREFFRNLLKDNPKGVVEVETIVNASGFESNRIRPEFKALQESEYTLTQLLGRFGLTPSDRSRVKDLTKAFGKPDKQDEFA
jgi:phage terminase small subunit